jgi:osmotically inducible lipoprotein OsmB
MFFNTEVVMKKLMILSLAALTLALAGCQTAREQNAVGGAVIGGGTGALIGGLATGKAGGAYAGALIGGVAGAVLGANSTPEQPCYVDRYGRQICQQQQQVQQRQYYVQQAPRCWRDDWGRRVCER